MAEVDTATRCLLSLLSIRDPSPEQVAGVALLAWHLVNTRHIAERLKG